MATLAQVVSDIEVRLSQVPGIATQIYATARLQVLVQDTWDFLFIDKWWDELMLTQQVSVDGVTGTITSDLVGPVGFIEKYTDIRAVFPVDSDRQLVQAPSQINPLRLTGTYPLMMQSASRVGRPLTIYPVSSATDVVVVGRQTIVKPYADDQELYLDRLMLSLGACYFYASDDGTNPGQIAKFQALFQKRIQQVQAAQNDRRVLLNAGQYSNLGLWTEPG